VNALITREVTVDWYASGHDVGDGEGVGHAVLLFDPADPLAVSLRFTDDNVWYLGRDLLLAGLRSPAGDGDVRIEPYKATIAVTFYSPRGRGLVLLPRRPVEEFAQQIRDLKAAPDIDGLIEKILAED
jgi:hypothetical protein